MILEVENLHTYYGASHVLQGVSLSVSSGEVVVLLGRNGAGKTTLLRSIVGLTLPSSGSVKLDDTELRGSPVHRAPRLGMVFVPSGRRSFETLTVWENLQLASRSCPDREGTWAPERVLEVFPKLSQLMNRRAGVLSGGEQQMLKIGRALVANPEILLLDEPTEGLAPVVVSELGEWIDLLRTEKIGILLAEQNALFSLEHADRGYILEKGRLSFGGSAEQVWESSELQSALGIAERDSENDSGVING